MVPMPIRTVRKALTEILLMTPGDLDTHVRGVMDEIVVQHGFAGYTSYAAKVGRGQFIEIHIVVEPDRQLGTVADLDGIRNTIADALDAHGTDTWLTVDFTGSEEWT
jgi:predicted Co/Zn/Cd cation transporter (cation efflux family)